MRLFWKKSRLATKLGNEKQFVMVQKYTIKLAIALKMVFSCCSS